MAPVATIYLATNTVNGKQYVGATRFTVAKRWSEHKAKAHSGVKGLFVSAIRKYGHEAFVVEPIASCRSFSDAQWTERQIIQHLKPAYNLTNGGEFTAGLARSREVIERIAAKNRGRKRSAETIARNSEAKKRQISEDPVYRAKVMAAIQKAMASVDREKQRLATSKSSKERVWTDASRAKLSASCTGRRYPQDIIERGAAARRKPVLCTTTDEVFPSCKVAAEHFGASRSMVYRVLNGALPSVHGKHFKYLKGEVSSRTLSA